MKTDLKYDKPAFLHWEGDPTHSRERLTPAAAVKPGDLLVLTATGYVVYDGTKPTVKSNPKDHEYVVAVALDAGEADKPVVCAVRNATLIADRINALAADAFAAGKPLEGVAQYFARQQLVLRPSVELTGKAVG